jgi:hypothetical protein
VTNQAGNCTTQACWGNPEQFLQDLAGNDFISHHRSIHRK